MSTKKLERTTFATSRLLDFASVKELTAQTGHEVEAWPLVIGKELFDNALDSSEEANVAPSLTVTVDKTSITVRDNGPGIPDATVERVLDFAVRVSSREAYVAPTRGAQGNALKTVLAMPFVLSDGKHGEVEIASHGRRRCITFKVDRIRQVPVIEPRVVPDSSVKTGTEIRVHWPVSASSILRDARDRFLQIADDYTWLNPSLSLTVDWCGKRKIEVGRTASEWAKWGPSDPTSAHWYDGERFARIVSAYVAHDVDNGGRTRTVREFIAEFRGLSASAKQKAVLDALGLARAPLKRLVADGQIDPKAARKLLRAMQKHSAPVKPDILGVIGREHLAARFAAAGCEMESFNYQKLFDFDRDGLPSVIETAFGWRGEKANERRLITGVNWSPAVTNPFRNLGDLGMSLDTILSRAKADADEPIIFLLHVTCPRVEYLDRGKSAVVVR